MGFLGVILKGQGEIKGGVGKWNLWKKKLRNGRESKANGKEKKVAEANGKNEEE